MIDIGRSSLYRALFISTKLALRFVSDDPPPALIDQWRDFYETDGDLRAVLKTMLITGILVSGRVPGQVQIAAGTGGECRSRARLEVDDSYTSLRRLRNWESHFMEGRSDGYSNDTTYGEFRALLAR